MKKEKSLFEKFEDSPPYIEFGVILIVTFSLILFIHNNFNHSPTIQDMCLSCNAVYGDTNDYDVINVSKVANLIIENCGSGFITKHHNHERLYIFKQECKADGFCKPTYIPLEECYYKAQVNRG